MLETRTQEVSRLMEKMKKRDEEVEALEREREEATSTIREMEMKFSRQRVAASLEARGTSGSPLTAEGVPTSDAAGPSRSERLVQESRVSALEMELTECREELAKQAKSHSNRLQEVQEACQLKLRDLKASNAVAVQELSAEYAGKIEALERRLIEKESDAQRRLEAALRSAAEEGAQGEREELQRLQQELKLALNLSERLKTDKEYLQDDLCQSKEETRRMENEVETVKANWKLDTRRMEEMGEEISRLKQEVIGHVSRASSRAASRTDHFGDQNRGDTGGGVATGGAPDAFIQVMEEKLLKLSECLRMREIEIGSLKKTVQEQCTERGDLMRQVAICKATIDELNAASRITDSGAGAMHSQQRSQGGGDNEAKRSATSSRNAEKPHDNWMKQHGTKHGSGFAQGRSRAAPRRHAMR